MTTTNKVDAKGRSVFVDDRKRTYVLGTGGKKVYVKKLFPATTPPKVLPKLSPKSLLAMATRVPIVSPRVASNPIFPQRISSPKAVLKPKPSMRSVLSKAVRLPLATLPESFRCGVPGLSQKQNTCWFNSAFNGLILASYTSSMLLADMKKLTVPEILDLEKNFQTPDVCPIRLSKKYIYSTALRLHYGTYDPNENSNDSANLVGKVFTPGKLATPVAQGAVGHTTKDAIHQLLTRLFGKNSFEEVEFPIEKHQLSKKFAIVYFKNPGKLHELSRKYQGYNLSHAVYMLKTASGMHVSCAYICDDGYFVYDSNKQFPVKVNWRDPKSEAAVIAVSGKSKTFFSVAYALYVKL